MNLLSRWAVATAVALAASAHAQAPAQLPPPPPAPPVPMDLAWVPFGNPPAQGAQPLLAGFVAGQPGGPLFACRAAHQNGIHPGKMWQGKCYIGWGGQEVALDKFEMLFMRPLPTATPIAWVNFAGGQLPAGAVAAGQEPGRTLGVCRAQAPNGWHPGKVINDRCSIGFGGREVMVTSFQVLVQQSAAGANAQAPAKLPPPPPAPPMPLDLAWLPPGHPATPGAQPLLAGFVTGQPSGPLLACRAAHQNGVHPGKMWQGRCYIGWGGQEVALERFELLYALPSPSGSPIAWVDFSGQTPGNAVDGGEEPGRKLGVCRAEAPNGWHPGKLIDGRCSIGFGGKEVPLTSFQVLVQQAAPVARIEIPVPGAPVVPLVISWVPKAAPIAAPLRSVMAGGEPGRLLGICRAAHQNGVHPGKLIGDRCSIGWGGAEVMLEQYEVMAAAPSPSAQGVGWAVSDGSVPPNALVAGQEPGRNLFVCRAPHQNGIHPGKVARGHCVIGWGGKEMSVKPFQLLVQGPATAPAATAGVRVVSAAYGGNCRAPNPDVTLWAAFACNGKDSCAYPLNWEVIGDRAPNCAKEYELSYECVGKGLSGTVKLAGEASGRTLTLACPN